MVGIRQAAIINEVSTTELIKNGKMIEQVTINQVQAGTVASQESGIRG